MFSKLRYWLIHTPQSGILYVTLKEILKKTIKDIREQYVLKICC